MNMLSIGARLSARIASTTHPSRTTTIAARTFSSVDSSPLDQFRDATEREKRFTELVGRSWSVKELRRKSFDDLHKLWIVLYKEKNMLLTESNICRRNSVFFPQKDRQQKTKKSMAAIKTVLGERKRDKIAKAALNALQGAGDVGADPDVDAGEEKKREIEASE